MEKNNVNENQFKNDTSQNDAELFVPVRESHLYFIAP